MESDAAKVNDFLSLFLLFIFLSMHLYIYVYIHLSIYLCIYLYICLSSVHLSIYASAVYFRDIFFRPPSHTGVPRPRLLTSPSFQTSLPPQTFPKPPAPFSSSSPSPPMTAVMPPPSNQNTSAADDDAFAVFVPPPPTALCSTTAAAAAADRPSPYIHRAGNINTPPLHATSGRRPNMNRESKI